MKRMLMLLIVLMISLLSSGCGTWNCPEPVIKVEHVYHYTPCEKDPVPEFNRLDPENHIGSAKNINTLIWNLEIEKDYSKSLLNTIDCYERQQGNLNE